MEVLGSNAQQALAATVARVERLHDEKAEVMAQIKEVLAEAKGQGFDPALIRKVVAARRLDKAKRQEELELLRLYAEALGCGDLF